MKRPSTEPRTYLARFAFLGTHYAGWQRQANALSVQQVAEDAFTKVTQIPVKLRAAGRTDAGVHALDMPADFTLDWEFDTDTLRRAWDAVTPPDICVREVREVERNFSARRRATARTYRYLVLNRVLASPFLTQFCWHVREKLDITAISQAVRMIEGEHDFTTFRAADCEAPHAVRRINAARVAAIAAEDLARHEQWWPFAGSPEDGLLCFTITGTAFLKHQVRSLVGTWIEVGRRQLTPERFGEILAARDRSLAGPTAPAHGLTLVRVDFPPTEFEE